MRKAVNILIKRSDDTEQEIMLYPRDTWEVDGRFILTCAEEQKSVSAKLPSPPSPVFKVGDNVRYKGTANTSSLKDNELRTGDVYEITGIGLCNDDTILLRGKRSFYGAMHFEPAPAKKFKVGDTVRLVQHGMLDDESSEWTIKDGLELRHTYVVKSIENTCVRVNEDGYWCESAHFEIVEARKFKIGDIVRLVRHGKLGDECNEWTVDADLKIGQLYKVSEVESDGIYLFGSVPNSTTNYVYHPNHFEHVATQEVPVPPRAFKTGDIVKLVRAGALDWEGTDWAKKDGLEVGYLYTVASVNSSGITVKESSLRCPMVISPLHFEYVATLVEKDC